MKEIHKAKMQADLKNCDTLEEILSTLQKYYDCKNCEPGMLTKVALITGLNKLVVLTGVKAKKEYQ